MFKSVLWNDQDDGNPSPRTASLSTEQNRRGMDDPSLMSYDESSLKDGSDYGAASAPGTSESDRNHQNKVTSETRLVQYSKMMVMMVLVLAAGGSATTVYLLASRAEKLAFSNTVESHANEIIDVSQVTADNVFSTIQGISITTSSYALDKNATFPFVTVPHFPNRAGQVLAQSGAEYLTFNPIVKPELRSAWEAYAFSNYARWVPPENLVPPENSTIPVYIPVIYGFNATDFFYDAEPPNPFYLPIWQIAPVSPFFINLNYMRIPAVERVVKESIASRGTVVSPFENLEFNEFPVGRPYTNFFAPVYDGLDFKGEIVGFYTAITPWENFFSNVLPDDGDSMIVVVRNNCGQAVTFRVDGSEAEIIAGTDVHNPVYDYLEKTSQFKVLGSNPSEDTCDYTLAIYPTDEFYTKSAVTSQPLVYTLIVLGIFFLTSLVFVVYDCFVQKRQDKVQTSADRSNAIVSNLFPDNVRDRLLDGDANADQAKIRAKERNQVVNSGGKSDLGAGVKLDIFGGKPIAELFPDATVLFADIAGFTSWSSEREPTQVFQLLETVYNSFDQIAKKRGVFKVETIGDCYVATTGLPVPRIDHAEAMAKFANETRLRMNVVVAVLETVLGPGTSDLAMRYGLHSGAVTAGVLRGEKSRFQLFGDTVNTASRIESSGERDRVHLSESTATLLIAAGKSGWVSKRDGLITAKGKGELQTYWLTMNSQNLSRSTHSRSSSVLSSDEATIEELDASNTSAFPEPDLEDQEASKAFGEQPEAPSSRVFVTNSKTQRLVDWNVDVLARYLKKVVAMRNSSKNRRTSSSDVQARDLRVPFQHGKIVIDEVLEIIPLPNKEHTYTVDPDSIVLSPAVEEQLRDYVATIAAMYRDNAFHSFDHASHVTQSVSKLLARVVTANDIDYNDRSNDIQYKKKDKRHEYTFGITSDPLLQLACAFSALVHDVDHTGLPNWQLVKEQSDVAATYRNQSVAEQNSVDIAWDLLMEPNYADLRECIYTNQSELEHFRRVVVNSVMATDIVDAELGALRKKRWAEAFDSSTAVISGSVSDVGRDSISNSSDGIKDVGGRKKTTDGKKDKERRILDVNRKATIVIEHLIQASDVSHTMQHWHVYVKWNEKLFQEMYKAYKTGHADVDPSVGWYEGELGFFDFYVIPLAKKLKECGVFGVASDEYLQYAEANRREWETKGRATVEEFLSRNSK